MGKLAVYEKEMRASPDQQISLTDPDSRSMATSGRGSGVVGYNVQVAVDTEHHLIVTHEVTNSGSDRAQLANMAKQAKAVLPYRFSSEEDGKRIRRYWTTACQNCSWPEDGYLGGSTSICSMLCSIALMRTRWPCANAARPSSIRSAQSRPAWVRRTSKPERSPKVAAEMAFSVLAYNLTQVMNIVGTKPLVAAIVA